MLYCSPLLENVLSSHYVKYIFPPSASTLGNCFRQAVRTMDFYLLVVSGVSTLSFWGGEAERIQSGVGGCRHAEFSPA